MSHQNRSRQSRREFLARSAGVAAGVMTGAGLPARWPAAVP